MTGRFELVILIVAGVDVDPKNEPESTGLSSPCSSLRADLKCSCLLYFLEKKNEN